MTAQEEAKWQEFLKIPHSVFVQMPVLEIKESLRLFRLLVHFGPDKTKVWANALEYLIIENCSIESVAFYRVAEVKIGDLLQTSHFLLGK